MFSLLSIFLEVINCVNHNIESNLLGSNFFNPEINEKKQKYIPKARFRDFVKYKANKIKNNVNNNFDKINKKVKNSSLYKSTKKKFSRKKKDKSEKYFKKNKNGFSLCGSTAPNE